MQIDSQAFLDLCEETQRIAFLDIESTGLKGDYNSVLVVSIKPYGRKPFSLKIEHPGRDYGVVRDVRAILPEYQCIVTYYGKGFDIPMLNTRLLNWGRPPLEPIHHVDMYFTLKHKLLTGRRSQGHLLSWLETPESKMGVSAREWSRVLDEDTRAEAMNIMVKRCESDVKGLEALYKKTRHLIMDIKRG